MLLDHVTVLRYKMAETASIMKCVSLFFLVYVLGFVHAELCVDGTHCYGTQYCCEYDYGCCDTIYFYSAWWFWLIWLVVLILISCCSYGLYRRRRAATVRYVVVQNQPSYGAAGAPVFAAPAYPGQPTSLPGQPQGYGPQQKPPPYPGSAPPYQP